MSHYPANRFKTFKEYLSEETNPEIKDKESGARLDKELNRFFELIEKIDKRIEKIIRELKMGKEIIENEIEKWNEENSKTNNLSKRIIKK